jgi:hypothetical protein
MNDRGEVKEKFQRNAEGSLIDLLCSRNARSRTPLAREKARLDAVRVGRVEYCAQWETNSGRPPGRDRRERGGKARTKNGRIAPSGLSVENQELMAYRERRSAVSGMEGCPAEGEGRGSSMDLAEVAQ